MRIFDCPLCKNKNNNKHVLRKCFNFYKFKNLLTQHNYYSDKLFSNDELGFCSVGIILYYYDNNKIYLLMLKEMRKGFLKLNFIGGGREGYYNKRTNKYYMETSKQTIINELTEELSEIYSMESIKFIREYIIRKLFHKKYKLLWIGNNKMVYYIIQIPIHLKLLNNDKACWVELDDLYNNKFNDVHNYTKEVVTNIFSYFSLY
jgi:hypothetical protein